MQKAQKAGPNARERKTATQRRLGPAAHGQAHEHEHHKELGFWRKYVFSQDHRLLGIQYSLTGLLFLLFGFTLMMLMRYQLAYPGSPIPLIGALS